MPSNSALHGACDLDDLGVVQRIVTSDANAVNSLGKFDRTPLHIAAKRGNMAVCKALLGSIPLDQQPQYLSLTTAHGFSALYCAVLSGETEVVDFLVSGKYPVDLEAADLGGLRPLHIAAEKGYSDIVHRLLLAGCDVAATDSIGRTSLAWAEAKGHAECVSLLTQASNE